VEIQASGRFCAVEFRFEDARDGLAARLTDLRVIIDGYLVFIPTNAFCDLRDVAIWNGASIAESAGMTYLTLSGGTGANAWQVKLTFRNGYLAERCYLKGGPAEVVRYAPPPGRPEPPRSTLTTTSNSIRLIGPHTLTTGVRHE
jgi:hypothetical protein